MSYESDQIGTAHLIIISNANSLQRNAVQAIVKAHTMHWWHEAPDVWIVEGHEPSYWRDLIQPVLALSSAHTLVFRLPDEQRQWATTAVGWDKTKWLHDWYSGTTQVRPDEPSALPTSTDPVG
jgi:hypothetical protein